MKVFAIGAITKPPTPEQQAADHAEGGSRTPCSTTSTARSSSSGSAGRPGVVFIMNVESVDAATAEVGKLPLTEGGFMTFEFIPVGPLAPLGRLIQSK